jgi:hypothetical protein
MDYHPSRTSPSIGSQVFARGAVKTCIGSAAVLPLTPKSWESLLRPVRASVDRLAVVLVLLVQGERVRATELGVAGSRSASIGLRRPLGLADCLRERCFVDGWGCADA